MKIVVIDGYTLNPGDLSWKVLSDLGSVDIFDRTPKNLVYERCKNAEIIITNKVKFSADLIDRLPQLKYIGISATGYNNVKIEAAQQKGVAVTNIPNYGTPAVAQHTFALILASTNQVAAHNQSVIQGNWSSCPDFSYWESPILELYGKTLGIIGFGEIGQQVAKIALAFGMKVLVLQSSRVYSDFGKVQFVPLELLLKQSDFITLHTQLTEENQGMVNADFLSKMKKTAYLINTARGGLIDEAALLEAVERKNLRGAALDVLSEEPPVSGNPLIGKKGITVTPHNAWASTEARQRLMHTLVENIKAFQSGERLNRIV